MALSKAVEELRQQGKHFIGTLKDSNAMTRGAMKQAAPRLLKGYLLTHLQVRSNEEVYDVLRDDLWHLVPEAQQEFLISYKPWPLDWLTVDWVKDVVSETHPAIASAIDSSAMLQESISRSIATINENLS